MLTAEAGSSTLDSMFPTWKTVEKYSPTLLSRATPCHQLQVAIFQRYIIPSQILISDTENSDDYISDQ